MKFKIELSEPAQKQLRQLDKQQAKRILKFLRDRLPLYDDPRDIGEALKDPAFEDLWRYRVGDYRILARVKDEVLTVLIVEIGHRAEVYKKH